MSLELNDELVHVRSQLRENRPDLYEVVNPHDALTEGLRFNLPELDINTMGAVLLGYGYVTAILSADAPCFLGCHHGTNLMLMATGDVLIQDHELGQKL